MVQVGARLSAGPLAALCVPEFPAPTLAWLQDLRARHDPKQFRLVAPHVTLIFPSWTLPEDSFVAHVSSCLQGVRGTPVAFSSTQVFRDPARGAALVYLVASVGSDWLNRIHVKLNAGPLAAECRQDIPYVPHITVGRMASALKAAKLARQIGSELEPIAGRVQAVDVVRVEQNAIRPVHRVPLKRA
jgi:2'-5' RNA ligase